MEPAHVRNPFSTVVTCHMSGRACKGDMSRPGCTLQWSRAFRCLVEVLLLALTLVNAAAPGLALAAALSSGVTRYGLHSTWFSIWPQPVSQVHVILSGYRD